MLWLHAVLLAFNALVVAYFLAFAVVNLTLLGMSAGFVRWTLRRKQLALARGHMAGAPTVFAPVISLIVPAYNEEVTIVDSVRSLFRLAYDAYEIILVNDGSADNTLARLREAFAFVRNDVDYRPVLGCAEIRGFYRASAQLPPNVKRLVLVDKVNGGKADALNAGINASQGVYVATMDADSLMAADALTQAIQPILDHPGEVVACGAQVALSNGCRVEDGKIVTMGVPKSWLARYQVVEYIRSFTQGRTALGQMNVLLILSGVFALFQRETLIAVGGFLTQHVRSRVCLEYCGNNAHTVCEDMEVVVRLHRYLRDHMTHGKVVFLPLPSTWTEAPESWVDLGRQRSRWYRGLLEVLWVHRKMLFRRRYGRIGMFALPYQLLFEALAPIFELFGYLVLPISWAAGLLNTRLFVSLMVMALAVGMFLSVGSIVVAVVRVHARWTTAETELLAYRGVSALLRLTISALLANFGYRQYLIYWQLRGLRDFLTRRKGWDKFARKGFQPSAAGSGR